MNKKNLLLPLLLLAIISFFCVYFITKSEKDLKDNDVIAWLNEEPVSYGEFKLFFLKHRADTISYFSRKYNAVVNSEFWTKDFGNGEIPIELAKKATLDELKKIKAEQILFKKYSIVDDISFKDFIKKWRDENKKRKEMIEKGKPIYGPEQYTQSVYYNYLQGAYSNELKTKLSSEKFDLSEDTLRKKYEELKLDNPYFKNTDTLVVKEFVIEYGKENEISKSEVMLKLEKVKQLIENKTDDVVISELESSVIINELVLDEEEKNKEGKMGFGAYTIASQLKPGQLSEIIDNGRSISMYQLVNRTEGQYKSFESVIDIVKKECIEQQYESLIEKELNNMVLKINNKTYNRIKGQ